MEKYKNGQKGNDRVVRASSAISDPREEVTIDKYRKSIAGRDVPGEQSASMANGRKLFDNLIAVQPFLTCRELATVMKVSEWTIRKWKSREIIPYRQFGRSVRFCFEDVLQALNTRR